MTHGIWIWVVFNIIVLAMLALDLGIFHRKSHVIKPKEALIWSGIWVIVALIFNIGVYYWMGRKEALEFFTGYLIERALSIDNIFVFLVIFAHFAVPPAYQYKVLFWGILGALVMRASMIGVGVVLIERFDWIIYVFGAFLVYTGVRMAVKEETKVHPETNPIIKWFSKVFPTVSSYHGDRFFIVKEGKKFATPLFVVLLLIESTDLVFALDSIPAIFAITRDPFIVYSSNVFAILGLRALYFALAAVIELFHFLKYGLSVVLAFVGVKMILSDIYHIPTVISLGVITGILLISIIISLVVPAPHESVEEDIAESLPEDQHLELDE